MLASQKLPSIIEIELTRKCNYRCPICVRHLRNEFSSDRELDILLLKKVLSELSSEVLQINLGGFGESLLCGELPELLQIIKESGLNIKTGFNTNGFYLDRGKWGWMMDGSVDYLSISLNAPTSSDYYKLTKSKEYEHVVKNAKEFLGAKGVGRLPLTTVHSFNFPEFRKKNEIFCREWTNLADYVQIRELGNWGGQLNLSEFGVTCSIQGMCKRPWTLLAIDLDGSYHRCCSTFGLIKPDKSIWDTSIESFWAGGEMNKLREEMLNEAFGEGNLCAECTGRCVEPNTLLERKHYSGE